MVRQLPHIRCPREVQHDLTRDAGKGLIQNREVVRLHIRQIKDVPVSIARTTPRRTGKDDGILRRGLEAGLENVKDVALDPPDLLVHAVELGIVFGARESLWVFFDGEDLFPAAGEGEGDDVAAGAGKGVDEDCFGGGSCCYVLCYFASSKTVSECRCS